MPEFESTNHKTTVEITQHRAALERVPLFRGLDRHEREQLTNMAVVERYSAGDTIIKEGETHQKLWIVLSGQCEVLHGLANHSTHEPVLLAALDTYESFGEMSFFDRAPHSATVRASTDVTLLCIERAEFDELLRQGSAAAGKLTMNAICALADRLRHMDDWVAQLAGHEAVRPRIDEWEMFRRRLFNNWKV